MQRLDKIQDFLSLLSAVGAQDTGDILLTIKGNLRKLAGAVVQSTGDRQTPLWEATLVRGVSRSGPVCVTINLEPYSTLSSSRSILKITGLVPAEEQGIIVFSWFIQPFMMEPPCNPV